MTTFDFYQYKDDESSEFYLADQALLVCDDVENRKLEPINILTHKAFPTARLQENAKSARTETSPTNYYSRGR